VNTERESFVTDSRAASHIAVADEARRFDRRSLERFDRIAFAMRALRVVRPEHMRVAVYTRTTHLRIERGRDLDHERSSWALVGIPPDASRQSIALALAELAGLGGAPFVVDLLCAAGSAES
jgi:hypothetical protein